MTPSRFVDSFDALHDEASRRTGLADFGTADYQAGLRRVLESFDKDVPFTGPGRQFAFGALVGTLTARLFTQEGWKRNPGYAEVKIQRPLVIVGLPRTGTTALHQLLSMDTQFQGAELWLISTPMVRPPRETWETNPSYQACVAGRAAMRSVMPELSHVHEVPPDGVEECVNVLSQSFVSNAFACPYGATSYEAWWWQQSERASYRRFADVLRLVGLADQGRRWLLKNPGHLWDMESLFEVFPDACVIQTHRDPAKAVPSLCSYLEIVRRTFLGENQRLGLLGPVEAVKWLHALHRAEAARPRREGQYFDMRHRDFLADPMDIVRRIYRRFDLELTPATETRMRGWLAHQPEEQKSAHRYTTERYGLSEGSLREMFADYMRRYGLA